MKKHTVYFDYEEQPGKTHKMYIYARSMAEAVERFESSPNYVDRNVYGYWIESETTNKQKTQ